MAYEFGYCRHEELPELGELTNRIFRGGRPGADMRSEYPLLFDPENLEGLRVARGDGKLVAHVGVCVRDASILGARVRVASIGAVGTDPDHRGHGTASRLMADARQFAVDRGASLMLISGGRGLYHRLGYVQVGRFLSISVPAGPAEGVEVAPVTDGEMSGIVALHQAEAVRFFRSRSDWEKLLNAGMLMNQAADLLTLGVGGRVTAYAAVQRPVPDAAGVLRPARMMEFAGSREAVARALPQIAARYGAGAAEVVVDAGDPLWPASVGTAKPVAFTGTLGIIDPTRFLEAIQPLVRERVGNTLRLEPAGEGAVLTAGGASAALATMGQLTALVFGGDTEEARAVPDLPPAMRAEVERAFPLRLLWYGYNYV